MDRRNFLKTTATTMLGTLGSRLTFADSASGMPYRTLGHTGEKLSLLGVGGYHIGISTVSETDGIQIVRTALDSGVNFLDNCWDYNKGDSEIRMGKALRDGYRAKAFLMTKIDGRTAQSAMQQLDESLARLQTDHLDLLQIHEVIHMNDPELVFAPGGAIEALVKAKQAGKIRYIGFTGHKSPQIHLHMLDLADKHGFVFDSVQMPLNVMDAHYNSFADLVLPVLAKKNIGALAMKTMAFGEILTTNTVTAPECLRYAMNLPVSVCIAGCDSMKILQQGLDAARNFKPMTEIELAALLSRTEAAARDGKHEPYKRSTLFDRTTRHPKRLC
jgi:predicted aldo/keto reductase-like oxidoreductase